MPPELDGTIWGAVTGSIAAISDRLLMFVPDGGSFQESVAVSALFAVMEVISESGTESARAVDTDIAPVPASVCVQADGSDPLSKSMH
jgi:hypothetical protein